MNWMCSNPFWTSSRLSKNSKYPGGVVGWKAAPTRIDTINISSRIVDRPSSKCEKRFWLGLMRHSHTSWRWLTVTTPESAKEFIVVGRLRSLSSIIILVSICLWNSGLKIFWKLQDTRFTPKNPILSPRVALAWQRWILIRPREGSMSMAPVLKRRAKVKYKPPDSDKVQCYTVFMTNWTLF